MDEGESKQLFLRLIVRNTHLLQISLLQGVFKQCAVKVFTIVKRRWNLHPVILTFFSFHVCCSFIIYLLVMSVLNMIERSVHLIVGLVSGVLFFFLLIFVVLPFPSEMQIMVRLRKRWSHSLSHLLSFKRSSSIYLMGSNTTKTLKSKLSFVYLQIDPEILRNWFLNV